VRERGVINYFGLQRFGSGAARTHEMGAMLLKGSWEEAVRMVFTPVGGDSDGVRAARAAFLDTVSAAPAGLAGGAAAAAGDRLGDRQNVHSETTVRKIASKINTIFRD